LIQRSAAVCLVLAGGATAAQGYWLLMWAIWGRPTHPVQYVALLGSLLLIVAGVMMLTRRRAVVLASFALVFTWSFWGLALVNILRADWSRIHFKPAGAIPIALLVIATLTFVSFLITRQRERLTHAEL
jgi:hypothetical protein